MVKSPQAWKMINGQLCSCCPGACRRNQAISDGVWDRARPTMTSNTSLAVDMDAVVGVGRHT